MEPTFRILRDVAPLKYAAALEENSEGLALSASFGMWPY